MQKAVGAEHELSVATAEGTEMATLLQYAASTENTSEHPLANAIVERAKEQGLPMLETEDFEALPASVSVFVLMTRKFTSVPAN